VVGADVVTGSSKLLPILELKRVNPDRVEGPYANYSLDGIADADWAEAERRMAIIRPLLQGDMFVAGAVERRAKQCSVSRATVYRWLSAYTEGDQFLSLMPRRPGWKKGQPRISDEIERIIQNSIKLVYLNTQRKSKKDVHTQVKNICEAQGLPAPSIPTVYERIKEIPIKVILKARGYPDIANDNYEAKPGAFQADYPLHRIQIDHTPGDVIIVDDEFRRPIGRPYVTLAIDMYSRMIVGYYLSLDAPSAVSVAMCLVHAMLPKHKWLNLHGVEGEWNVWGKPYEVHSDNGSDFKTKSLIQSCIAHGIEREFRPRRTPHWGGQIESLMNTSARAFATLPGATARGIEERGSVDPDGTATISFSGFEKWFLCQVIKYNNSWHSTIGTSPNAKWREAILGSELRRPICGMPPIPEDPLSLEIDFLPGIPRTVQTYGVEWNAFYYSEILRPWIKHKDPETGRASRLMFRRDPRDINYIWFFDPVDRKYYKIPMNDQPLPGVTVSVYKKARKLVRDHGLGLVDHDAVKKAIEQMEKVVNEESEKSKAARRSRQKKKSNQKNKTPAAVYTDTAPVSSPPVASKDPEPVGWSYGKIELFGDVDD